MGWGVVCPPGQGGPTKKVVEAVETSIRFLVWNTQSRSHVALCDSGPIALPNYLRLHTTTVGSRFLGDLQAFHQPAHSLGSLFVIRLSFSYQLPAPIQPSPQFHSLQDPELLRFIDIECFIWSTVSADLTPMINAGMVFCDRHYGGINYPVGGVGRIGEELAEGEDTCEGVGDVIG